MSTKYEFALPAKQVFQDSFETTLLHMDRQNVSFPPAQFNQSPSRRAPTELTTQSLPQTSWLSDVAPFTTSPTLHDRPSRKVPRARSRDYLLSTTPNSTGSQSPRHSPSPVLSPTRTLQPSRSFTNLASNKTPALASDASGHLDLKRLMSKPAKQTSSGSLSVSEQRSAGDPSSSHRPSDYTHPPLSRSAHASREKMSLHVNTTGLRSASVPRQSSKPSPGNDTQATKPTHNVLVRRTSARSSPMTPATHLRSATDDVLIRPTGGASMKRVPHRIHDHRDSGAPFSAYTSGLSPRPATSPLADSPKWSQVPTGLTPAGAVAHAYMQQEQRREELAETASFNDAFRSSSATPPKPSGSHFDTDSATDEGTGGPYYTVFGSASGRLVAVGSAEDDDWHYGVHDTRATVSLNGKPTPGGSRSLSRKVSGSFKRVAGSIRRGDRELSETPLPMPLPGEWKPYDGNREHPVRKPIHRSHSYMPSKHAASHAMGDSTTDGKHSPRGSPTTKSSPTKGNSSPRVGGRNAQSPKAEESPGSKWWKLMKRLSTGALREKYQHFDALPPPVPALPKNLQQPSPSRATLDITTRRPNEEVNEEGVLLRKFMQSRRSLSGVRQNPSPPKTPPSTNAPRPVTAGYTKTAGRSLNGIVTKSRTSVSGHRPSIATRSSSPGSSDKAASSILNHNRTPSTRSSCSSYGEEIPPLPKTVGQHIVSPSEFSRMTKTPEHASTPPQPKDRIRTPVRSHTAPGERETSNPSGKKHLLSLPLPPRRVTSGSPIAPSFNVEDTVMPSLPSAPPPMGEFGMNEPPPPRPKRSSRRVPPQLNVELHVRSQSASATMPLSPQTPRAPPVPMDAELPRRPSVGALSHRAPKSAPSSSASHRNTLTSPSSAISQNRSPLTFRELQSPRHVLSEKEKTAKWEDLLERSARAGGTLHLGESRLMSDEPGMMDDRSIFDVGDD